MLPPGTSALRDLRSDFGQGYLFEESLRFAAPEG
jgi:EAL domain-containing protein (putative c-di-GMP-specific phosphodiesterase class I)